MIAGVAVGAGEPPHLTRASIRITRFPATPANCKVPASRSNSASANWHPGATPSSPKWSCFRRAWEVPTKSTADCRADTETDTGSGKGSEDSERDGAPRDGKRKLWPWRRAAAAGGGAAERCP